MPAFLCKESRGPNDAGLSFHSWRKWRILRAAFPLNAAPASNQAGRLRIRHPDGTEVARAVSPNGRRGDQVSREWLEEFGMGTITHQGLLYRVVPDIYLGDSFALN